MRVHIIDEICEYIEYLKASYGFEITVHPMIPGDYLMKTRIVNYNSHSNHYCQRIKLTGEGNEECIQEQYKAFSRCRSDAPFRYECFAGVSQLIYPMSNQNGIIGYIAVGSFCSDSKSGSEAVSEVCRRFSLNSANTGMFYDQLLRYEHDESFVSTLINPLRTMIEYAYGQNSIWISGDTDESFYIKVLTYIKTRYTGKISIDEMCAELSCSRSYISHFFKKASGMSIPEYVNSLRIGDAKLYLSSTGMSIQETATATGFANANYFSSVFKKVTGKTPGEYRKDEEKNRY